MAKHAVTIDLTADEEAAFQKSLENMEWEGGVDDFEGYLAHVIAARVTEGSRELAASSARAKLTDADQIALGLMQAPPPDDEAAAEAEAEAEVK